MMGAFLTRRFWTPIDYIAALLAALGVIWISVPSNVFVREVAMSVHGDRVTFTRQLPFGEVVAEYTSEITTDSGFECNLRKWEPAFYQKADGDTIHYILGEWAHPCLERGEGYTLHTWRSVRFLGRIPLRASLSITRVDNLGSTQGKISG